METIIQLLSNPWPWYIAGPLIAVVMGILFFYGKTFGVSSNLRTVCTVMGAGKGFEYFNYDWKSQVWNLLFVLGSIIGGALAHVYLGAGSPIQLNEATISELSALGISDFNSYIPEDLFNWENLLTAKGLIIFVGGGFLIGFGTRYAGGCTSGHAITGLSNLQIPSLIAVIGFFIGGLLMTHLFLPMILAL
jgi:hypothetical protein